MISDLKLWRTWTVVMPFLSLLWVPPWALAQTQTARCQGSRIMDCIPVI